MPARRTNQPKNEAHRLRPATTPEARENQLVARAFDLAEQQILNGTASSQVISHFLKLGSSREKLEQERLRLENELTTAKTELMAANAKSEELMQEAIAAMRGYQGLEPVIDLEPED